MSTARSPWTGPLAFVLLGAVLSQLVLASGFRQALIAGQRHLLAAKAGAYNVELLVTRHGLSCANIVEQFIGWYDAGREKIHDPLLSGAATQACVKTGEDVEAWLEKSGKTIDATVSSVLGRAMETALRSYPKYAKPLFVVPYIRETSSALSNAPKEQREQLQELVEALDGHGFKVDYRWANAFGIEGVSWDKFKHFLANSFLPDLVARSNKTQGSTIVLAVVTHSNFMRDSEVGNKCAHFWKNRGAKKALNNQVLKMTYTWKVDVPSPGSADVTPVYDLAESDVPCDELSGGQSTKDASGKKRQQLCLKDIGKCAASIQQSAWMPHVLWAKTYEKQLMDVKAQRAQALLERESARHAIAHITYGHDDWAAKLKHRLSKADKVIEKATSQIESLMQETCWSGGRPQDNLYQDEVPWRCLGDGNC